MLDHVPTAARYDGEIDASGRPSGQGTQTFRSAAGLVTYTGGFKNGQRDGEGVLILKDGREYCGAWEGGRARGVFRCKDEDDEVIEGPVVDGDFQGRGVRELYFDGDEKFVGEYKGGVRWGQGVETQPDGSQLRGQWVDGLFEGAQNEYVYPGGEVRLVGQFRGGRMVQARCAVGAEKPGKDVYRDDSEYATAARIVPDPLLQDPYEAACVCVKNSRIEDAGEGLFTLVDIPKGRVFCFYAGVRLSREDSDPRSWDRNAFCISLNPPEEGEEAEEDEVILDIPPEMTSTDVYKASLAHKVNHAREANSEWDTCMHPRFGEIRCLLASRDIAAGEEVFVDYGYGRGQRQGPKWFRDAYGDGGDGDSDDN